VQNRIERNILIPLSKLEPKSNKMLSYRRETAVQGALVLAESGELELGDNILRTLYVYFRPL